MTFGCTLSRVTRRCAALPLLLMWLLVGVAQARVVGIVFDDSGSMAPRIHLPAFGAQVLVSALDGRPGKDRLVTTTLKQVLDAVRVGNGFMVPQNGVNADNVEGWVKQYAHLPVVTVESLATSDQQQAAIDRIATQWTVRPVVGTPYEPVEVMLDYLVRDVKPGETAVLIFITDGEFNTAPDLARIRASYNRYKERLAAKNASLRVEYLLIAPSEPRLLDVVAQQKVRSTLLEMFNGDAQEGSHDVLDIRKLLDALKDVTARVSGTDWRKQGQYITTSGNAITIESPLSLTQITSIATAQAPAAPTTLTTRFPNAADTRKLTTGMRAADELEPIRDVQLRGITEQIRLQPALPPGRHVLTYDRPVGQDVSLLFATGAFTELTILELDGTPVVPDSNTYILALGRDYRLEARLKDDINGAIGPVNLGSLKTAVDFTTLLDLASGARAIQMSKDVPNNRATGLFKADPVGPATLTAQARLEGFVTSPSQPLSIQIVDMVASFRTRLRPLEDCPGCAPNEARVTVGSVGTDQNVGTIEIIPTIPRDGTAKIDLDGLSPGMSVIDSGGNVLKSGDRFQIKNGQPVELRLRIRLDQPNIADHQPFRVGVAGESPLLGKQSLSGAVTIRVPEAHLRLTGHAGGDPSVPLHLTGENLRANGLPMDFLLSDSLMLPSSKDMTIKGGLPLLSYRTDVHDYTVHVRPVTSWWCVCVLSLWPSEQTITVEWRHPSGLQTASAEARFELNLSWLDILTSCFEILLLLLILIWFVFVLITTASANRFPRGSVAEIIEGRELPRFVPLRGRNFTFLRALLPWPLKNPPHERRVIEGIPFEATPGGANILLDRTQSDATLVERNETLAEIRRTRPRMKVVKLIWRNQLEQDMGARMLIRLLRSLRDRQNLE